MRIIFLDDMLVMAKTLKQILHANETLIFNFQTWIQDKYNLVTTDFKEGHKISGNYLKVNNNDSD